MVFLIIVGVPFLALIVFIGIEAEKRRSLESKEGGNDFTILFKPTKHNIIFWTIFVLLNLAAFLIPSKK